MKNLAGYTLEDARMTSRRAFLGASLVAASAAVVAGARPAYAASAATSRPVRTESGLVSGIPALLPGVTVYKGVPYGASTAGPNRWLPPRRAPRWDGVFKADTWGAACPQDTSTVPAGEYIPPLSEDCLNLNIWTAAADPGDRRPVYVWAYGASQWSAQGLYDGAGLARKGLVMVTFNRRAGAFGSLATSQLSAESPRDISGNYILWDTLACLQWVRRNIAAFGGDPDNVTLAGQSAGAAITSDLVYSPLARGLFHRAQVDSGIEYTKDPALNHLADNYATLAAAEATGATIMSDLGVTTMAQMRELSASALIPYGNLPEVLLDGYLLPATFHEILASGSYNDMPYMTGNNKDENNGWMSDSTKPVTGTTIPVATYLADVQTTFGSMADDFLALYPASTPTEAADMTYLSGRDDERISTWMWGTEWLARAAHPVFSYYFTHTPPGQDTTNPFTGTDQSGAYHGAEIYYMLDNLYATDRPWKEADYRLADTMSDYVVNFATHGDPNGPGLARWKPLDASEPGVMELGDGFERVEIASSGRRLKLFERWFNSQTVNW
jgi:carboxylesterase type B